MISRNIMKEATNISRNNDITKSFEFTSFYHHDRDLFKVINNTKKMKKKSSIYKRRKRFKIITYKNKY